MTAKHHVNFFWYSISTAPTTRDRKIMLPEPGVNLRRLYFTVPSVCILTGRQALVTYVGISELPACLYQQLDLEPDSVTDNDGMAANAGPPQGSLKHMTPYPTASDPPTPKPIPDVEDPEQTFQERAGKRFTLTGKIAIVIEEVTGGAQGLGIVSARAMLEHGLSRLAIFDVDEDQGKRAIAHLESLHQSQPDESRPSIVFRAVNVTDEAAVDSSVREVATEFSGIDILVSFAGITGSELSIDYDIHKWKQIFDVNLHGSFLVARAVAREMIARQIPGSMVFIASMSGYVVNTPQPHPAYAVSKAAVHHLARSLAGEWVGHKIRVNSISPGIMNTRLAGGPAQADLRKLWLEKSPMGIGDPEDLTGAVILLCSEAGRFITGTDIKLDGKTHDEKTPDALIMEMGRELSLEDRFLEFFAAAMVVSRSKPCIWGTAPDGPGRLDDRHLWVAKIDAPPYWMVTQKQQDSLCTSHLQEEYSTIEPNTILNKDPFHNPQTQRLFEAIDELRSCGVTRENVELPELVIVGDQSAGKSSLLQSLTEIPFPVADRLCTRFPTRIVSRRTPGVDEITKVSIESATSHDAQNFALQETPDEKTARLEAYSKFAYSSPNLTPDEFRHVLDQVNTPLHWAAKELMGITRTANVEANSQHAGGRNFSQDVLKIEISGPDRSYFSILDVPGVFQSLTKGLTEEEKKGVRKMVASYMAPRQSVIICVASGTNDLANQAAFDMASKQDPSLERTIGILSLAQNQEKHLNHGWFVVRNRTPSEIESGISPWERHDRERSFFESSPWATLPESRRGTQALKQYLADLLCGRIQEMFPSILATIQGRRAQTLRELDELGLSRNTIEEKRVYLTDIAQQYHQDSSHALSGRYHGLSNDNLKLRRYIREANDTFSLEMVQKGHCVPFQAVPRGLRGQPSTSSREATAEPPLTFPNFSGPKRDKAKSTSSGGLFGSTNKIDDAAPSLFAGFGKPPNAPGGFSTPGFGQQSTSNGSGLFGNGVSGSSNSSFGQSPTPGPKTPNGSSLKPGSSHPTTSHSKMKSSAPDRLEERDSEIYRWIRQEISNCRGTELQGTLNPDVLPALFHRQIVKWKEIATRHFGHVAKITTSILQQTAKSECRDVRTTEQISELIKQRNVVSEEHGLNQLLQRIDQIASHHLQTQNPIFEKNIQEARLARFQAALERYQARRPDPTTDSEDEFGEAQAIKINLQDVTSLFDELHMSNAHNLEHEIHDILNSYYHLALHDFIEYVTQQVVESYLNHPHGPVLFFNPTYIGSLTPDGIEKLGSEDPNAVRNRIMKQATLATLTRAEEIALKYA
ncbi:MAG: hypothetical protein Q9174_002280 [Haloplaca sp. 1 TL-2023]